MMVGGAIVNAFAFSGSNFLFHKLSSESEERKRHDKAMEKLNHDRDEWVRKRQERIYFINNKLMKERNSEFRFNELGKAVIVFVQIAQERFLMSELNVSNQHFFPPAL